MERFYTLVFVAGIGCFGVAILLSIVFPVVTLGHYHDMEYQTLADLSKTPSKAFIQLAEDYPEAFDEAFGEVSSTSFGDALQLGRDLYVGQACWHCHSQFVRVVSSEEQRFGLPSSAQEYQNALSQPHLWGTRRVGPDLTREGGLRTNDWHIAHLMKPKNLVPSSVMPNYPYYFQQNGTPEREGFALVTYLQWLGTTRGDEMVERSE